MKLKEYATKIKNRLMGQNAKPQKEEKMVKSNTETFERLKPAFEQVGKAIAEAFRKTKWTGLQLRKELISNNRRKMKGMPMIRAKAIEKARRNERRKPKKWKEGVQCAK